MRKSIGSRSHRSHASHQLARSTNVERFSQQTLQP